MNVDMLKSLWDISIRLKRLGFCIYQNTKLHGKMKTKFLYQMTKIKKDIK